jgi:cytochrome c2
MNRKLLVVGLVLGIAIGAAGTWFGAPRLKALVTNREDSNSPVVRVTYVDTSMYDVERTSYVHWIEPSAVSGGGLARFGTGLLLATGDGRLFIFRENAAKDGLQLRPLHYSAPLDALQFDHDARRILGGPVESERFRVADVQVQSHGENLRLFVSHHYWNSRESCFGVRVSVLEGSAEDLLGPGGVLHWATVYTTSPCLKLNTQGPPGSRFAGLEMGGRMALLDDETLLLTVGDLEFDGWNRKPALAQDPASPYGKTMLLHLDTGAAEVYTLGHRNPQGLEVDARGVIWSTEHGPRGGDELNLIRQGANYGWPKVTYGTEYAMHRWPLSTDQGRHEGFEKPLFAFVPSGGISEVISVRGQLFELWRGDLLVSFLKFGRLERVRVEDGRVIFTEPIRIGRRIRSLVEAADGRIVLWTDEGEIDFLAPSMRVAGEALSFQCASCHAFKQDGSSSIGPLLWGVVGRKSASLEDFHYSAAMRNVGGIWTRERLDAFLANPRGVVPGTTMQFPGMADAAERARLIDYLETLKR